MGEYQIFSGGELLTSLNSPRLQVLLAYLLLHRTAPQSRRFLAFLLWPDSSESQARTNLRNLLHALRMALPNADDFVRADVQTLQWRPESAFTLDVAEFERAAAQASDSISLHKAVDLYPGALLPGCYDDWIQPERERLQELYIEMLERLISLLEQENDPRAAIRYAEHLLRQDPLRESTYRLLMRLHAKNGDRLGVVRVYQMCVHALKSELNVAVSSATQAAYEQLLQAEMPPELPFETPGRSRYTNLPVPLTGFIGREQQIASLEQILSERITTRPRVRLLTLTGAGGSGKTRLAIETAGRLVESFPNGVWLVELAPLSNPQLVPQAVAAIFGLNEQKGRPLLKMLMGYLESRSLLLILDNCEHLLDACAHLVEALLQNCPQLQVLATSRERLNLPGEFVWLVPPLSLPDAEAAESLEQLKRFEAVRLFVERASAVMPTFELNQQNANHVVQICRQLDGMPLAIELAAARVRALSVEQIMARLQDRFHLLMNGSRTALPRHQTLWNLIDWSYELLPNSERVLLRRLVIFSGGWTLEAAKQVGSEIGTQDLWADSNERSGAIQAGDTGSQVLNQLTHLVDTSLITYDPQETPTRYHMYDSIRAYGRERLLQAGENDEVHQLHRDYFLQWVENLEPELRGPRQLIVMNQLENELDNLRDALDWSPPRAGAAQSAGLRLAVDLTWFWIMKGFILEGRSRIEAALRNRGLEEMHSSSWLASVFYSAGLLAFFQNDYQISETWLERSVAMWQSLGDDWNLARARAPWAFLLYVQGHQAQANACWEADLAVLQAQNDRWGMGWILSFRGRAARDTNDFEAARPFYLESARLFQAVGDEWTYAIIYSHLGRIEFEQGNYAAARSMYTMRLAIGQKMKSITHIRISHEWLAEIAKGEGDVRQVLFHCKKNLQLCLEFGNDLDTSATMTKLAWALCELGQWRDSVIFLTVAERLLAQLERDNFVEEISRAIQAELSRARTYLDESAFSAAMAEGKGMTVSQAISSIL